MTLTRGCNDFSGCGEPRLENPGTDFFSKSFLSTTYLTIDTPGYVQPIVINLKSTDSRVLSHTRCGFDPRTAGVTCEKSLQRADGTWSAIMLRGHMSRECLKLTWTQKHGAVQGNNNQQVWIEQENIIFSKFRLDDL
jgi:hypothetical protein